MRKRSIRELELRGKRVFIRVDFNVPIADGVVGDDTRIRAAAPTIRHAVDEGAIVILASHLGRPKGQRVTDLTLAPVASHLSSLLNHPVTFVSDCIGQDVRTALSEAVPGTVVLLENLRFHAEEEGNDPTFAAELARSTGATVYINDAFGAAHRAHASTVGILPYVQDAGAGLLMADELHHLGTLLESPDRPFAAVIGGSKVSGKLEVIENLLTRVDALLIGGAMAYTFFLARNWPTGRSLVEPDLVDATRRIEAAARRHDVSLMLPTDHVVADRIEPGAKPEILDVTDSRIDDRIGLDIGPSTAATYSQVIQGARTVIWNGPMGVFEIDAFASGTMTVAHAVAESPARSVIGGGDSIAAVSKAGVSDQITHVSTGGGASLEFLGGRTLPGVAALPNMVETGG